ncbi:hypothetical protein ES703_113660 [subsurface metagenome]
MPERCKTIPIKMNRGMAVKMKLSITPYVTAESVVRASGLHRRRTNRAATPPMQKARGRPVISTITRAPNKNNVISPALMIRVL